MIDLHTHILPYIDDGAATYEEAVILTELLRKQNVEVAVCTPHFDPSRITMTDFLEKRASSMSLMKESDIRLLSGSETALNDYLFHYMDLSPLCVENTNYLLLELPYKKKWENDLFYKIEHLIDYYGVIPIIAHIERYQAIKKSNKLIKKLIDIGCIIQVNADSIVDKKTRARAFQYMKKGYIDVLASDCHNTKQRMPKIAEAYEVVRKKFGDDFCLHLMNNSKQIIEGKILRDKFYYLI